MKNIRKRLTAAMSSATVVLSMCGSIPINSMMPDALLTASAAVSMQCDYYAGSNLGDQIYLQWSNPIDSYLTAAPDGGFMRFQNGALDGKYLIEYYDSAYNIQETMKIDAELPIFGGFYETEMNYFVLTGQENPDELAETECYRITKYDKDWNRLGDAGLYDCNTTIPFDAGSARFAVCGEYLLIRTCHEMYTDENGLNHQANVMIQLDMENMEITDSITEVSNNIYGYVSHSFNQFIHVEDGQIISLDHGDAIPRSLVLMKYNTDPSTGTFVPEYDTMCDVIDVVTFPDSDTYHYNFTGASVGGFEISGTSYLAAYTAENYADNSVDYGTQNIMIGVVNKETDAVTNVQLTNYEEGSSSASTPHLVKVNDSRFVVLWNRENNVYYTAVDAEGNPEEIHTIAGASLSDCKPIVSNGKVIWYTWNNKTNTFYEIDMTDLSRHSETIIENGHRTEIISKAENPGDECTVHCTQCGKDFTFATPADVTIWWHKKEASFSSTAMPQSYIGDTIVYEVEFEGGDPAFLDYEMIISDTEHITEYPISANEAELTLLKEGKYTIDFVYPYCEAFNDTEQLKVNHYEDHTLVKTPAEEGTNIAHMICQDCDYTDEFIVPSAIEMWFEIPGGYMSTTPEARYCPDADTVIGAYAIDQADNYELTIEFSDLDMAVFTEKSNYYYDIYGSVNWQKEGTVDVTIYPTYNPWVKRTFSLEIGHSYSDGICTGCGQECPHESGYDDLPNCVTPGTCAECGIEYGDTAPENHSSEDVKYENAGSDLTHNVLHACCDAFIETASHQYTEESAGKCELCEYECQHLSDNFTPADCQNVSICGECGLTFGEIDPYFHASEDVMYLPNAEDAELHDVRYACCDSLKDTEVHNFVLDEETGSYTCVCGAEAAWMLTYEDETAYYCNLDAAIVTAEIIPESVLVPMCDMSVDPFVLTASFCTLDLNGLQISINNVPEKDYAVVVEEMAKLRITDSKGGGRISAPDGMDLFILNGGTIEIMGGTLLCDGAVIRDKGTASIYLYGGTLIGENGVVSENGDLILYSKADLQCTGMDLQIGTEAMLYVGTDLHGAGYTVSRKEIGTFAILAAGLTFDDTWFVNQAENRVLTADDSTICVRYDFTKADVQLNQEEFAYSGNAVTPNITGTFEGISLEAAHYEIRYIDADENDVEPVVPGEYYAVITGIGDFAGTVELPFHITNAIPVIQWQKESAELIFTGETSEILPPEILLTGEDVFDGEIVYSYRTAGAEETYEEGLPVNTGSYEIMAAIEAFGYYTSAETEAPLLLTIAKAPAPVFDPVEVSYPFTASGEKMAILPDLPKNTGAFGDLEMTINDPDSLLDLTKPASYDGNALYFHTNQNHCTSFGKSAEIIITIPTENYEDIVLKTVITMDRGELTLEDFIFSMEQAVYSGSEQSALLSPVDGVLGVGDMVLTYYDENGKPVVPVNVGSYTITAVIGEGEYYNSTKLVNPEWTFTITPAIPEIADPIAMPITYGQSLADSELTEGWTWADDTIIPTVKNDGYKAVYTVEDANNYDYVGFEGFDPETNIIIRTVKVTVAKADPIVTPLLVGVDFTEGDTLPEITLSENDTKGIISWIDKEGILKAMENSLEWQFVPEDAENYNEATGTMIVFAETTTTTESTITETTTTEFTTTETTTTESTTTETAITESTTTESQTIVGYTYTVQTQDPQFYFSHDSEIFQPEDLIESVIRFAVYSDGTVSENSEILEDMSAVDFGGLTPEMIYTEDGYAYLISASITDEFGTQTIENAASVYIGEKGDANLDGMVDAIDAAAILTYAAADGAGQTAYLISETDAELETLALMLANVDASAKTDANDAAFILAYAALIGSGEDAEWDTLIAG